MDEKDKEFQKNSDSNDEEAQENNDLNETGDRFINQGVGTYPASGQGPNPNSALYQLQTSPDKQKQSGSTSSDNLTTAGKYLLAGDVIAKTDELKTATQSLQVNELEKIYFDRKVRPLVDTIYELSTVAQNFAGMSNLIQANNYGKKRDVKKSLDLAVSILDEADELWGLVRARVRFFEKNIDPYE
ncbi:hypothetical protein [Clostridium fungisolvens]|uniref:Uncharacterized protein n=1 Tax=Clostridium fungisolvens TaxID=1604897 RepID=A0A6V8SI15_9CLOT|nr:hypothetical protein [Clostridium fungisolvens]GFP76869.1 hypothetical protein bsdtw1_02979 [Clostridium fungisolvens]